MLAKVVPAHLVWVTHGPRKTYGETLVDENLAVDPDATIWNTDERGKPGMVHLARTDYQSSGAEAGIRTANKRVPWQVAHCLERRESPHLRTELRTSAWSVARRSRWHTAEGPAVTLTPARPPHDTEPGGFQLARGINRHFPGSPYQGNIRCAEYEQKGVDGGTMTIINVDGVQVIFEGIRRLRWEPQPAWAHPLASVGQTRPREWIVGSVWPNKSTQALVRRQIDHGQRTLVVFDGTLPIATVSRERAPKVPVGAVELDSPDDEKRTLFIPPLIWLSATDRARGEAFSARAKQFADEKLTHASTPLFIEQDLIGTREPLRFVYRLGAISIGELSDTIKQMYHSGSPVAATARQGSL